jgi:hypothetical protein
MRLPKAADLAVNEPARAQASVPSGSGYDLLADDKGCRAPLRRCPPQHAARASMVLVDTRHAGGAQPDERSRGNAGGQRRGRRLRRAAPPSGWSCGAPAAQQDRTPSSLTLEENTRTVLKQSRCFKSKQEILIAAPRRASSRVAVPYKS